MGIRIHHKGKKSTRSSFSVVVFVFCAFGMFRIAASVEAEVPNEEQLVAFYQATAQKSLFQRDRWIIKVENQQTIEGAISKTAARKYLEKYIVYRDRDRIDSRKERIWMDFPEEKNRIDKTRRQHVILDGRVYSYNRWIPEGEPPDRLTVSNNLTGRVLLSAGSSALSLAGYMLGDKKPLAEILTEESSILHAKPSMQTVNGFRTYVLEATTPYGHYTVWMDPDYGYNPRRVIVERGPKDLYSGKPVSTPPQKPITGARQVNPAARRPTLERARFVLDILKIKDIGDGFMATEGTTNKIHEYSEGPIEKTYSVCKFNLVDLNPDFNDVSDAFVLDAPNGTRVFDFDFPGARYEWQDGKIVTRIDKLYLDAIDDAIQEIKDKADSATHIVGEEEKVENHTDVQTVTEDTQLDNGETEPELLLGTRSSPMFLFIIISMLFICIIGWQVYRRSKTKGD